MLSLTAMSSFFVFFFVFLRVSLVTAVDSSPPPPLILPLHLSSPDPTLHRQADDQRRRLQQSKPNAHMRLYDDLLSNGYYTTRLYIGTPPQQFALIVDTGSTVTYVPCSNCKQCGIHQDPRFRPEMSSTYEPLKCNPDCNCDSEGKVCVYDRQYAEKSSSSGALVEDIVSFGNESQLVPQRAVFGCENVETGDLYSQRADGIMGLGSGPISIVDQLVDKRVISNSFSLCYGGMDVGGGAMVLGEITTPPGMIFSHSDPHRSPYYNIGLKEIQVAGTPLKLNPKVFDGRHGTVLDSGTTYAYLPRPAFAAFKDAVIKAIPLKRIHGPDPKYEDICFSGAEREVSELSKFFPEVEMVFSNGEKLLLTPENYLFRHTKVNGAYCLGIFENGDSTTLLGGIVVRNTLVTYDRKDDKIGFWKTNCSELWSRLQFPATPAPPPIVSSMGNTSAEASPVTPDVFPSNILPGAFQIGFITFDMSIIKNNSYSRPNFTELAAFIAHELEILDSQVHLLNLSSEGDYYFTKWGIFPAESATYISNTTALNIIKHLREHHMQFPEKFGKYQLLRWNVEPQVKQTWWRQHAVAVTFGIITAAIVGFMMIGVWLFWRKRREENATYKPVDTIVVEQELQPLQA